MRKFVVLTALMIGCMLSVPNAKAGEPDLGSLGLGSMTKLSHSEAMLVRGQTSKKNKVNVKGSTIHANAGGIIIVGGGSLGNGFIGGLGGIGYLSGATSSYDATGTSSASGVSFSKASIGGAFTTSKAKAK